MGSLVAGAVGIVRDVACVACISRGVVCVACIARRMRRRFRYSLAAGRRMTVVCRGRSQSARSPMMNTIMISSVILSAASSVGICNIRPFIVTPSPYSGRCSPSTAVLSDLRPIPRVSGDKCPLHLYATDRYIPDRTTPFAVLFRRSSARRKKHSAPPRAVRFYPYRIRQMSRLLDRM